MSAEAGKGSKGVVAKSAMNGSTQPFVLSAAVIARLHTFLAYSAFSTALVVACALHYKKIVKNGVAGYPEEWFPSVSATIGDWYPERNIFQILIALTAGPRIALVLFQYYLHFPRWQGLSTAVFVFGMIRTLSCGGWVYITSSDDHDIHDIFMIMYMVCNIPWMVGGIACTEIGSSVRRSRVLVSTTFFVSLIPLVYFFLQHKLYAAYTHYSFFEWGLILLDVLYDSYSEQEFRDADLHINLGPRRSKNAPITVTVTVPPPQAAPTEKTPNGPTLTNGDSRVAGYHVGLLKSLLGLGRDSIDMFCDVYLCKIPLFLSSSGSALTRMLDSKAYVSWSVFTSLVPTLFYFSVWELGIAGHELALLATLSPVLLGSPLVLRAARTRAGQVLLHLVELVGVGPAFAIKSPLNRLFAVAIANAGLVLRLAAKWSAVEYGYGAVVYHGLFMGLGLVLASFSKHLDYSNNPLWPFVRDKNHSVNRTGLLLALAAVVYNYRNPRFIKSKGRNQALSHLPTAHWLTASLPLGALIFSLHNLLSDPSTLVAWSWTGYQTGTPKGPHPHLHASLTLVVQSFALLVPLFTYTYVDSASYKGNKRDVLLHPLWFGFGAASAYITYAYRDWTGYAGGLAHALFLMSVIPSVWSRAAQLGRGRVARTYAGAFLVYCLFNLASIFTVAYAFVPGGEYFRERTDCVMLAQVACLALAFEWPRAARIEYAPWLAEQGPSNKTIVPSIKRLLALIPVLSVLATLYRGSGSPPSPFQPGPRIFNAGIWTLHFGIDNEGRDSQRGVTDLIRDMQLDVVGFLETDLHRTAFGHRDLTRLAVEELGYFPIINSTHHLLPSPRGELAPAIEAVLDVYGTAVNVVVAHNGQEEDPLDRELQSRELARIMAASYPRPVVFLGYVVTKPHAPRPAPYEIMVEDGKVHDIDSEDEDRWCEYIFYRGLYRTAYARLSRGIITDTELQIGQFALPKHGVGVTNETRPARYLRSYKEKLPEHHWFPMEYYGDEDKGGVNGHFYHVFGTPLYYNFPEDAVL
ncbi:hypothetical protein DXG03_004351 [Asterophora parasitica]|uniref:Calcofluor white hypersensitive protein n=1 Tax=Asterophora parasitica TaxID=117018 RepID=A0A9P7G8P7_9AGAR|nr:hypothetical protein DXG03_004351 [Asterophora parasitica]